MAKFILTPGTDNFTGVAGEDNTFEFTPLTLQSTDMITGASGGFIDVFALTSGGTITVAQLAGVSGIERLTLAAAANITLTNGLVGNPPGLFQVEGSSGADTIDGSLITNGKGLLVFAGDGDDTLTGGNGDDTLVAHTVPNIFAQEHDTLSGGAGNDTLFGEAADTLDGGTGFDVLQAINDFSFNLDLVATGIEYVVSGFGNDIYTATAATTTIEVYGGGGNDQITGGSGGDNLWAGVGDDTLVGNNGDDLLVGDLGADSLSGGAGNDRLYIDSADTFIDGGADFDAAYIATGTGVNLNMNTTHLEWVTDFAGGNDTIDATGVSVNVEIYGAGGTDNLTGGSGNDLIFAGSGDDTVAGGAGDDALVGETGADSLSGGAGNDRLYVDSSDTLIDGGADTDAVFIEGGSGLTLDMTTSNVEFVQDNVAGADVISGVGTSMRVFAGGGDDTIGITNSGFTTIDGGGGLDRLALTVASQTFDVTANVSKITGIEVISLDAALNATLSLTSTDIPQITSANSLYVTGGLDDHIDVGGGDWVVVSTTHENLAISGGLFTHYHNNTTFSALYVQNGVDTDITIAPPPEQPPVNTAPAAVVATEDEQFEFNGLNTISVADPDSGVTVTLSVDHGVLNVTEIGAATAGGNGTDAVTITGASISDINDTLATLTYLGALNFNGNDTLTIATSDGALSDTDTVAITVNAANDNPVAAADLAYTTAEDTSLVLAVLGNDTDVDGPLPLAVARIDGSAVSVGQDVPVTGGSVHVNADGTLTFTPAANSTTDGAFTYTAKDGSGAESNTVSVAIDVTPANDAPAIAAPASAAPTEDLSFAFTGGNAITISDIDAGAGNVTVTLNVGHGTLTAAGAGVAGSGTASVTIVDTVANVNAALATLSYTGDSNFNGADGLIVSVNDGGNTGAGGAQVADKTIVLNVASANDDPVATADLAYTTAEDTPLVLAVLGNDTDVDGPLPLAVARIDGNSVSVGQDVPVTGGSVHVNADGTLTFTPTPTNSTTDGAFTYTAKDGSGAESNTVSVAIDVTPVNDTPVANADTAFTTPEDTPLIINLLANDTDVEDGTPAAIARINGATILVGQTVGVIGGTVTLNLNQTLTFNPDPNSTTDAFFTYTAKDSAGVESAQATVSIDVTPDNDGPTAAPDGFSTPEDTAVTFDVRANDTDIDSPTLTVTHIDGIELNAGNGFTVTLGDGATVHRNGSGTLTYTPALNAVIAPGAPPEFSYTVSDGLLSSTATVNVTVTAMNDTPVAAADSLAATEDGAALVGNLLTNDSDVEDGTPIPGNVTAFTVAGVGGGTVGTPLALGNGATLTVAANGAVTLTQNSAYDYLGTGDTTQISLTYTVTDSGGASDSSSAVITVTGANDAPVVDLNGVGAGVDRADTALYTSGGTAINVATAIATVTDVDTNISKITLTLTADAGALDGAAEGLYLPTGAAAFLTSMGFTVSGEGTASLEIMSNTPGGVSPAVFEGILETVVYRDTDTTFAFNPEDRSIAVTATDGSGLTSTPAALVHVDLAADVTDTGGLDSFAGANRDDTIRGASGNDTMEGKGGDDTIYGGTEASDSGLDTAVFTGDRADYTITRTGAGVYTVADSVPSRDGTDTVHDVETLDFDDVDVALDAPIQVFDSTGNILLATFQANELDLAVDFADGESGANVIELRSSASPFTASVWPVTIDDAVTIKGVGGAATVNAGANNGFVINPSAVNALGETVRFEQLTVDGNGTTAGTVGIKYNGVYSSAPSELGTIELDHTIVTDFASNGLYVNGGGTSLSVSIQDSALSGSGYNSAGSGGSGDVLFFEFTGNADLNGVEVTGTNGIADNGIQIAGFQDGVGPANDVLTNIGVVSFTDVSVTGDYAKNLVYVQGYNDFTNLSFAGGLSLGDAGSSAAWTALFIDGGPLGGAYTLDGAIDGITDSTLDLTGVTVAGGAYGTSPNFLALGSKQIVANGTLTDDLITGTSAHEAFNGLTGNDTINAGGGNDLILYNVGHGQDTVDGQGGTDTLGLLNFNGTVPSATAATFALSESAGDLIVQTDGIGAAEVDAAGMESVQAVLGNGGDTVTLTGNIAGAGIATGPGGIIVTGGTGSDSLDASGLTSASAITFTSLGGANDTFKAANVVANDTVDGAGGTGDSLDYSAASAAVAIDLQAGTASGTSVGSDTVANYENATGGAGGDSISGTAGVNTLTGNGGFDTLTGRGDNDILVGSETGESYTAATGEGDVAGYTGAITRSMIAEDGLGGWTVTSGGEGTDSLSGIEIVDGAEAGRFLLVGNGGFATLADAYAEAIDGDTIVLAAGTYTGPFTISKAITISGANYSVSGDGVRATESVIDGNMVVNAAGAVAIEGVRFLNTGNENAPAQDNPSLRFDTANNHTVANSIFFADYAGGANANPAAFAVVVSSALTSGSVTIDDNYFTGSATGKFSTASWNRGVSYEPPGGVSLTVTDNTFEYQRTGINTAGTLSDASGTVNISGNTFKDSGTGVTLSNASGLIEKFDNNVFTNTDTDLNGLNLPGGYTFDAGANGNSATDFLVVLGGNGVDSITGTTGKDAILGNDSADTISTGDGDDAVFWNVGDGSDTIDGGEGAETNGDTLVAMNRGGTSLNPVAVPEPGAPDSTITGALNATAATFNLNASGGNVTLGVGAHTVTADNIEHVRIEMGTGGDTVNVSGDFNGTDLSVSTITVTGGTGNDTVDASGLTSNHRIVFNGGGGDDTFVSSNAGGNDTFAGGTDGLNGDTVNYSAITGGGVNVDLLAQTGGDNGGVNVGSDTLTDVENVVGTAQDDIISGDGDANMLTGGGGIDTSGYSATASTAATFGVDGSGHWTVTIASVTDTLVGVEKLVFSDKTVLLVDHAGANVGGFQTVQSAIDFASGGETILIRGDTIYSESHTTASGPAGIYINKAGLTLQGTTATGALITDGSTAQSSGPTIVSAHQNNFGANHWVDVNGDNTVFNGVHLKAGDETNNKVLEFWAENVTVTNSFIDSYKTMGLSEVYTFAVAIYINDNGSAATDEVTAYTIDGNILNEGIVVANGVGDPSLGISAAQKITENQFIDTFDLGTGLGRYDTIVINGQVNGIGWLLEPTQTPTITGNTVANNTVPFILRGSDNSAANLPTSAQIGVILANNFDADVSYAYVVDSTTGDLVLATRNDGFGPYRSFAVTNTIDTLNLALDTTPDNVFGGQRDYIHAGDTIIVQSGAGAPVDSAIMVDNLKVQATANSADLDLTMATNFANGSPIPGGVNTLTLTDYAAGLGADVDVTGNALDNVIVGNSGANTLDGGMGDDTLTGGKGIDALTGGGNTAAGDTVDYSKETGTNGVTVDLGAGTATDTFGNSDTLSGIENAIGTAQTDTLTGSAGPNVFTGKGGDDTIHGGDGSDVAVFSGNMADYTITWDGTTATVIGPDGTDTIDGVGELRFGDFSAWLVNDDAGSEFTTIQSAVNAADAGDKILVANGSYTEQVAISGASKNGLSIIGESEAGVVVHSPGSVLQSATNPIGGAAIHAIVTVVNANNVTIQNLTVDGDEHGDDIAVPGGDFNGIAYVNSSGTVEDVTVDEIRDPLVAPGQVSGVQRGNAIHVTNTIGSPKSFSLIDSTITGFQKTGVVLRNASVTVSANTVAGFGVQPGALGGIAQNGIQLSSGSTGSVTGNHLSAFGLSGSVATVVAILVFDTAGLMITGNDYTGTGVFDAGIFLTNVSGSTIGGNSFDTARRGIVESGTMTAENNVINNGGPGVQNDYLNIGTFNHEISATASQTTVFTPDGSSGPDRYRTGAGNDVLTGNDGNDQLESRGGIDQMLGGDGDDTLTWRAGDGNDTAVDGGADNDTLQLFDTAGSDTIQVVTDGTTIVGLGGGTANVTGIETVTLDATGGGTDTLDYTGTTVGVTVNLGTNTATGINTITGTIENATGGTGDDTLTGSAGNNTLDGGAGGNDTFNYNTMLFGGIDTVIGGEGTETTGDVLNVTTTSGDDYVAVNPDSGDPTRLDIDIDAGTAPVADAVELDVTQVEHIAIDTGAGNDTVVVSGDLGGTGVSSTTVTVNAGGGNDVLDASGVNGATPVRVVLNAGSGADVLKGGAADDTLSGGTGAVDGGTNAYTGDRADYAGNRSDYSIVKTGAGTFTVTGAATGIDTLTGVEGVRFLGAPSITYELDSNSTGLAANTTRFDQGFETDVDGIIDSDVTPGNGDILRVASGTGGIASAHGTSHAVVTEGGTGTGPFTRFDGYRTDWTGGFTGSVAVYLDETQITSGQGFDISLAANGQDGNHRRDYIFHVANDTTQGNILVGGSNNTNFDPRQDLETINHAELTTAGWYTFEWKFYEGENNALEVAMNLYDAAGNWLFTETRNDGADLVSSVVGGNRYLWFTNVDVTAGIAIDDVTLKTVDDNPVQLVKGTGTQMGAISATTILQSYDTISDALADAQPGNIIDLGAKDYTAESPVDVDVNNLTFRGSAGALNVDLVLDGATNVTLDGAAPIDVAGNASGNAITGNLGANTLQGLGGDDVLHGGGGNDDLQGGAQTIADTATYDDVRGNYTVTATADANGFVTAFTAVQETSGFGAVDEATDSVSGIETLQFSGTTLDLADAVQLFDNANQLIGTFDTLKQAADAANANAGADFTIRIAAGDVDVGGGQVVINKNITIDGAGIGATALLADSNTTTSGDGRGLILVNAGKTLNVSDLTIDGDGHLIWQAIRHLGSGDIDRVHFEDIQYQVSGGPYAGTAIAAFGGAGADVDVTDSVFTNIGRVGILYFGAGTTGTATANTFTGKGAGDWLDYAIEVGAGASADLQNNIVTGNLGVAVSDGSTSAAFLVTTFFGGGTTATLGGNTVSNSTTGLAAGFNSTDSSTITFQAGNDFLTGVGTGVAIEGNVVATGTTLVDGTFDWNGGAAANQVIGGNHDDVLRGNGGIDNVEGNGGDDLIVWNAGDGNDTIDGGDTTDDTLQVNSGASNLTVTAGSGNFTVGDGVGTATVSAIEEVDITLGSGTTATITGDFEGTGINVSTITVTGGAGNETVNASGMTNADAQADDSLVGIDFTGGTGDDTFHSGVGNDSFHGGGDLDTAIYGANYSDNVTWDGSTATVTGARGTDSYDGVGKIVFNDKTVWLVNDDAGSEHTTVAQLFDGSAANGEAASGDVIMVASGIYTGDFTLDERVTILGANAGKSGTDVTRVAESDIAGRITINAAAMAAQSVTLDGLRVVNTSNAATQFIGVRVSSGVDVNVENSVFYSPVTNAINEDRGITLETGATGTISIEDNLFTGDAHGLFGADASWHRGIWSDGRATSLNIDGNTFEWIRSAMNLDDLNNSAVTVSNNNFTASGTGIAFGDPPGGPSLPVSPNAITAISNNDFSGVNEEFSFRNITTDVTFDADVAVDVLTLVPPVVLLPALNPIVVLGGSGNDTLSGTDAYSDILDGNNAPGALGSVADTDTLNGRGGDDFLFGRFGDDTLNGGAGADALDGGAGDDTATYAAPITEAMITVDGAGWKLTTGGAEGTDALTDIEIIDGAGAGRFLLVGNGGYATLADALADVQSGDTILVAPGTYAGNVTVGVANVAIKGVGAPGSVVLEGAFKTTNSIAGSVADHLKTAGSYTSTGDRGVLVAADNVTLQNLTIDAFQTGVELGNGVNNVTIKDVIIEDTVNGIRKGTGAQVTGLDLIDGEIRDSYIGMYLAKETADGLDVSDVLIDGTDFTNLTEKGIYAESLANALITGITMTNVGEFGRGPAFGTAGQFGNGIDINLKWDFETTTDTINDDAPYSGITIEDFDFTNVGSSDQDGGGAPHLGGAAIAVKARNLGSYAAPETASFLGAVIIQNGTINGTSTGIRAGEPGQGITDPDVTVTNVEITNEVQNATHGDVDNVTLSPMTVNMLDGGDTLIASPTTTGTLIVNGGTGDDTITTRDGADTVNGGGGTDTVNTGGGNDTVIGTADGVADNYTGGTGTDTIDYSALTSLELVSVNLATGFAGGAATGTDTLSSFENANGGAGNDSLFGSNANNVLHGNGGTDNLVGGGGSDQLFGEADNDTLNGGVNDFSLTPAAANDVLWGGTGTDTFRFEGRFGDDSIGTAGNTDWEDGEDMVFVGYATQTPIIADVAGGVMITIDDGSVFSSVFVAGATSGQMQQVISGGDLLIH